MPHLPEPPPPPEPCADEPPQNAQNAIHRPRDLRPCDPDTGEELEENVGPQPGGGEEAGYS